MTTKTLPPYSVTISIPGKRWKIVHRTPGEKTVERVYFVSLHKLVFHLECSCPAFKYGKRKPCKHCRFIAKLINKPWLVDDVPF